MDVEPVRRQSNPSLVRTRPKGGHIWRSTGKHIWKEPKEESVEFPVEHYRNIPDKYVVQRACHTPILPKSYSVNIPPDIMRNIRIFRDKSRDEKTRSLNQRDAERYLVERGSCDNLNPDMVEDLKLRIFGLDSKRLKNILSDDFMFSMDLHSNLECAINAIIYNGKFPGEFAPSQADRVRNWFSSLKQIGKDSVEGYAMKPFFSESPDLFVMKAPKNPQKDELVHEALVGFYGLNRLRHYLPNYMYIYGYIRCSSPVIENRDVITWCSSAKPAVSYLIVENIKESVPIFDFILDPNVSYLDALVVFYQIVNALNIASKTCGYTHYDLHHNNVMVRRYPRGVAIPYFGTGRATLGYLVSQYVPYIIDYGYSRISINEMGFGKIGLERVGIEAERPFLMFDIYKLMGFLGEALHAGAKTKHNEDMWTLLETLFSFFREGKLSDRVARRLVNPREDYYLAKEEYRSISHDDYLVWMQTKSNLIAPISTNPSELMKKGIIVPPTGTNMDICTFYNMVSSENGPETGLEYCEAMEAIKNDSKLDRLTKEAATRWLNDKFDAEAYFVRTIRTMTTSILEINQIYESNVDGDGNMIPDISKIPEDIRLSRDFMNLYKGRIIALVHIKDRTSRLMSFIKSSLCSLSNQGQIGKYESHLKALRSNADQSINFMASQKNILLNNLELVRSAELRSVMLGHKSLPFWETEHENLILAL